MNEEKKYELVKEDSIEIDGHTLYRIKALKDFSNVKKGDIGGYIEKEENLSHKGDCWIYNDAKVYDNARVCDNTEVCDNARVYNNTKIWGNAWISGDARVYGNARVFGNAWISGDARVYDNAEIYGNVKVSNKARISSDADYVLIKGLGTKYRNTTFFKCSDGIIKVNCGCFNGTIDEFREQVKETREGKVMEEYLALITVMEIHFKK